MKKWKCFYNGCNFEGDNKKELDAHKLTHDGNGRPWQCISCDKSFMERTFSHPAITSIQKYVSM